MNNYLSACAAAKKRCVGIDLGTSVSLVSTSDAGITTSLSVCAKPYNLAEYTQATTPYMPSAVVYDATEKK
jgi:molecular chaperone DnaK (HSP70)